jgi:hypothetical protein
MNGSGAPDRRLRRIAMFQVLKWLCPNKRKAVVYCCLLSFCCLAFKGTYVQSKPQENLVESQPKVLDVLSDFQYIGKKPKGAPLDSHVDVKPQDLPREFEPGTQYIWLKRAHADNQEIFKALQDRLRDRRITILDATGMMYRFIGGLAFKISFQDGHYKGMLFNTLNPRIVKSGKLNRQWGFDNYVLVFEETPLPSRRTQ